MEHAIWISIFLFSFVVWIHWAGAFTNNIHVRPERFTWRDRLDALRRQLQEEQHRLNERRLADARIKAAIEAENRLRQEEFLRNRRVSVLKTNMAAVALNELAWAVTIDDTVPILSESTFEELENTNGTPLLLESMNISIAGPTENIWKTVLAPDRNTISNTNTGTNQVVTTAHVPDVMFESAAIPINEGVVKTHIAAATTLPLATTGSVDPSFHEESVVGSTMRPLVITSETLAGKTRSNELKVASKDPSVIEPTHVSNVSTGGNRTINITTVTRSPDSQKVTTNKHELGETRQPSAGTSRLIPASLIDLAGFRGAPTGESSITTIPTTFMPSNIRAMFVTSQQSSVSNETVNPTTSVKRGQNPETVSSRLDTTTTQSISGDQSITQNPWDNADFFGPLGVAVLENVTIPAETTAPVLAPRPRIVSRFLLDLSRWFISQRSGNP